MGHNLSEHLSGLKMEEPYESRAREISPLTIIHHPSWTGSEICRLEKTGDLCPNGPICYLCGLFYLHPDL